MDQVLQDLPFAYAYIDDVLIVSTTPEEHLEHLKQYNEKLIYLKHWLRLHVFVRHDAVRKPLQSQYDGPYLVLERTDEFFKLNINGHKDTVSIDRLKPAYLDTDSHSTTPSQTSHPTTTRVTCSG